MEPVTYDKLLEMFNYHISHVFDYYCDLFQVSENCRDDFKRYLAPMINGYRLNFINRNQYKYTYERLKTENNELKEKIKKYSHYLRRKSGPENDQKLFNVIKEKELMINKYKKEIIDRRIKERERFFMLINKYDKTLISQENENKTLKMRLKELERQIH